MQELNSAAISMYRSCGFHTAERLFDHYHIEGQDYNALRMVKYINLKKSIYEDMEDEARGWCTVM